MPQLEPCLNSSSRKTAATETGGCLPGARRRCNYNLGNPKTYLLLLLQLAAARVGRQVGRGQAPLLQGGQHPARQRAEESAAHCRGRGKRRAICESACAAALSCIRPLPCRAFGWSRHTCHSLGDPLVVATLQRRFHSWHTSRHVAVRPLRGHIPQRGVTPVCCRVGAAGRHVAPRWTGVHIQAPLNSVRMDEVQ